jgi:hypothetical protein
MKARARSDALTPQDGQRKSLDTPHHFTRWRRSTIIGRRHATHQGFSAAAAADR